MASSTRGSAEQAGGPWRRLAAAAMVERVAAAGHGGGSRRQPWRRLAAASMAQARGGGGPLLRRLQRPRARGRRLIAEPSSLRLIVRRPVAYASMAISNGGTVAPFFPLLFTPCCVAGRFKVTVADGLSRSINQATKPGRRRLPSFPLSALAWWHLPLSSRYLCLCANCKAPFFLSSVEEKQRPPRLDHLRSAEPPPPGNPIDRRSLIRGSATYTTRSRQVSGGDRGSSVLAFRGEMLQKRWQGCVLLLAVFLVCCCKASDMVSSEDSRPSEFAKIVQSKQMKHARVCPADPQLLSSLAGDHAEVMVTIPNEHLEQIAEFQEEADIWVIAHVARFLPTTQITHVVVGDDAPLVSPGDAYFLVPAMLHLRSALAAAGLDGRVTVTSALSAEALAAPAWSDVAAHVLRFLKAAGAPLFLKSRPSSDATDASADAAFAAMRALGVPGVPVVAGELGGGEARGGEVGTYYAYGYAPRGGAGGGRRRSLATGTFCVALQNADPAALQTGLNWACGPGHADCSAIQPGGPCYKENNLPALASYAYNDYYQKQSSTGATCSFNGTATTTTTDPSSGSCVFAGSSTAVGGSNSTPPVGASPPTSFAPPAGGGFTPPGGSSPPSSDFSPPAFGTTPPTTGFTPPAGGGFGPPSGEFSPPSGGFGSPPGSFNGSGTFGPTGTLSPYGAGCRGAVSSAGLTALFAVAVAVLLASMDVV